MKYPNKRYKIGYKIGKVIGWLILGWITYWAVWIIATVGETINGVNQN